MRLPSRSLAPLAVLLGAVVPVPGPDASIDSVVDEEMRVSGAPGAAYAVVADGAVASEGARGVVRVGGDEPVTPETQFVIGSISKSFTALAVMQLVEDGRMDLDAPVSRDLEVFAGGPAAEVTIRQLLSHTSGYSTLQGNTRHGDVGGGPDELARQVDQVSRVAPAHLPGERWEYSNTNYQILGRVVEVVSGEDYETYVTTHILEPIGMSNSVVPDGRSHPSLATGHRPWFWTERPMSQNVLARGTAPAGGIVSSAGDLALYMQTMLNGEDDVLSAAGKALMMRPVGGASPFYGLGWFVDTGTGTVWHSGSTPGFETLATMMPARGQGVVVLVNSGSGIGFGETAGLRNGVTAQALGLPYDGEGPRLQPKAVFVGLVLLPFVYLACMV